MAKRNEYKVSVKNEDGELQTYILKYDNYALSEIEDYMGRLTEYGPRIQAGNIGAKDIRTILWGSLLHNHEGEFPTLRQVSGLLDLAGEQGCMNAISDSAIKALMDELDVFLARSDEGEDQAPKAGTKKRANLKTAKPSTSGSGTSAKESDED